MHISLTRFRPESENDKDDGNKLEKIKKAENHDDLKGINDEDRQKETCDAVLEGKILNQLIHQIPAESIPHTNFRVKKDPSGKKNVCAALFAVFGAMLILYMYNFNRWVSFADTFAVERNWLLIILRISTYAEMRFVVGFILSVIVCIFVYHLIKLQQSHSLVKKAAISGVEIEIFRDSNDSYFDKYLNEVLYLFKNVKEDAIVFEDIDRYDSSRIFERLHEVNRLVNSSRKNKPPLRFLFLLKDDIFISKDRTKFFDFILPIVPIIDASNSFDKFIECFREIGIDIVDDKANGISHTFLQGLSFYIDDMRILQNICNEFTIYSAWMNTTEQDVNKMLALVTYKNLFPRDFAELQLEQGFMYEIVGEKRDERNSKSGRERLILTERTRLQSEIEKKNKELMLVRAESLETDELAIIYARQLQPHNYTYGWTAEHCKNYIESQRRPRYGNENVTIREYDRRVACAEANPESRKNRIVGLENEIQELRNELTALKKKKLYQHVSRENIDAFFAETTFTSETGGKVETFDFIKDSPYFPVLKYFVREGFIDETYSDYMTYFFGNSIKATDKIFLRSVTDKKKKEEAYELNDPDLVASRLPLIYFDQEEVLNFSLFSLLLFDFTDRKTHAAKTKRLIKQIRDNKQYDFLVRYASYATRMDDLVETFGAEWADFVNGYFTFFSIGDVPSGSGRTYTFYRMFTYTLFILTGADSRKASFINEKSKSALVEYVSKDTFFLNDFFLPHTAKIYLDRIRELSGGIKSFGVKFAAINKELDQYTNQNLTMYNILLRSIYENNSYVINHKNIAFMLSTFYGGIKLEDIPFSGYTIIMNDEQSPLAKYVNENMDVYIGVVLENCSGKISDSEKYALSIINNIDINIECRKIYISYLNTVISNLREITDHDLWEDLLKNQKALEYTAENIVAYFEDYSCLFDKTLVDYINAKGAPVLLGDLLSDDKRNSQFFNAVVSAITLNDKVYEGYVSQFSRWYRDFTKDNLSIEKLSILDKLNKIRMTAKSLGTMRSHYAKYLYIFICRHIRDYISVVSVEADEPIYIFDEMLTLLDKEISVEHKIDLLKLTQEPVSIKGKRHPDELSAYILNNNYDEADFEYLVSSYEKLGEMTKAIVFDKAIQQIDVLKALSHKVSRLLIADVLSSDEATLHDRQEIFKTIAPKASEAEIKEWLSMIELDEFLDVYDKNKRPKFENIDINVDILEIFKNRSDITDFAFDESSGKYKIRRGGTFALLD